MKKRTSFLLIIILIFFGLIIGTTILEIPRYTSYVIKSQPRQVQFYFFDENNCSLNGYLFNGNKLIGKTEKGVFNLSYYSYENNFNTDYDITLFGKLGNCSNYSLYFDKSWKSFEIPDYYFLGNSLFKFQASINPNNPSKRELIGFITPEKVKKELENIKLTGETLEDLSKINQHLNDKINYTEDWNFNKKENYWQTPEETLSLKQGDCEDYSTTLLSLFLAYNSSLNCYNIIFPSHVTTFCYIGDYYIYYDQQKTELRKKIIGKNIGTESKLRELEKEYFEYYGINKSELVHYIFNEYRFLEFKNNDEFIRWQFSIGNKKTGTNLFSKLEQDFEKIPTEIEYPEEKEEIIELPTTELPSLRGFFKEYSTLSIILGMFLLILIILLIFLILKRD